MDFHHHKKKTLLPHVHSNGEERGRWLTLFGKLIYFTTILLKTKFQDCFTSLMSRNLLMNQIRYSENTYERLFVIEINAIVLFGLAFCFL
jgi:hypothetical protein